MSKNLLKKIREFLVDSRGSYDFSMCSSLIDDIDEELEEPAQIDSFQSRVLPWLLSCFGEEIANDKVERNHRFLEESLELVQSLGCTQSEAHQLVDYVFGRPVGEPIQEAGGVMVVLAALCLANKLDMHEAGEIELSRIWTKVEQIRAKQAAKPKHSPLPVAMPIRFVVDRGDGDMVLVTPETIESMPDWYKNNLVGIYPVNTFSVPRPIQRLISSEIYPALFKSGWTADDIVNVGDDVISDIHRVIENALIEKNKA
jgi:hypothetical protein